MDKLKCDEVLISEAQRKCRSGMEIHDINSLICAYRRIEYCFNDSNRGKAYSKELNSFFNNSKSYEKYKEGWLKTWKEIEKKLQVFINIGKIKNE